MWVTNYVINSRRLAASIEHERADRVAVYSFRLHRLYQTYSTYHTDE